MKQVLVILAVLLTGILIVYLRSPKSEVDVGGPVAIEQRGTAARSGSPAIASGVPAPSTTEPSVRRLDPEARKQLGEQIKAARARARANAPAGGSGRASDDMIELEAVAAPVKEAMFQSIPLLADCYKDRPAGERTAIARMTLTSDPELGTVIDTDAIKDAGDKPLDPKLEDCLRETIDTLGLPPLDSVGGKLQLQYSFRFDD